MPASVIIPAAATLLGPEVSKLLGGSTPTQTPSQPADLQPMRAQQIGLLNYLLGMGPDPRTSGSTTANPKSAYTNPTTGAATLSRPRAGGATQSGAPGSANPGMSIYTPPAPQTPTQGVPGAGIGGTTPLAFPWLQQAPTPFGPPAGQQFPTQSLAKGGVVKGPGTKTSDSVPAKLSNGEGVLTADAVQHLGGPGIIALLNHLGAAGALPHQMAARGLPPGVQTMPMGAQQILRAPGLNVQHLALGGIAGQPTPDTAPLPGGQGGQQMQQPGVQMYQGQPANSTAPSGVEPAASPSPGTGVAQTPQQRLESFFGPMGITQSPLQQQAGNAYSQFLNQPSPWDRASQTAMPQLQQNLTGNPGTQNAMNNLMGMQTGAGTEAMQGLGTMASGNNPMSQVLSQMGQGQSQSQQQLASLGQGPSTGNSALQQALQNIGTAGGASQYAGYGQVGGGASMDPTAAAALGQIAQSNPGQGVLDALNPAFQRNLAAADQTGGRFGTSNALGRQTATDQYNQLAQQALQQGVTQQTQAASSLGQLANQAQQTGMQGAIASAGNQLQGALGGGNQQIQALGLAQQGNLGLGQLGLGANSTIGNQQLQGATGLNSDVLNALQQLGGFNLQGNAQGAANQYNAGNLGVQQGNLGNSAAATMGNLANQQGTGNLNTVQGAFGAGNTNTMQAYQGQQNVMNFLQQLLGTAQGASIGGPVVSTPGVGTQTAQGLAGLLPYLFGNQQPAGQSQLNPAATAITPGVTPYQPQQITPSQWPGGQISGLTVGQ